MGNAEVLKLCVSILQAKAIKYVSFLKTSMLYQLVSLSCGIPDPSADYVGMCLLLQHWNKSVISSHLLASLSCDYAELPALTLLSLKTVISAYLKEN